MSFIFFRLEQMSHRDEIMIEVRRMLQLAKLSRTRHSSQKLILKNAAEELASPSLLASKRFCSVLLFWQSGCFPPVFKLQVLGTPSLATRTLFSTFRPGPEKIPDHEYCKDLASFSFIQIHYLLVLSIHTANIEHVPQKSTSS